MLLGCLIGLCVFRPIRNVIYMWCFRYFNLINEVKYLFYLYFLVLHLFSLMFFFRLALAC
jgi:hypothetical protein